MTYYGGKDLAAAFRTVRDNTIKIAEEIPENKYDFKPAPDCRSVRRDACAHRGQHGIPVSRPQQQDQRHEDRELHGAVPEVHRRRSKPRTKAELIAFLKTEGDKFAAFLEGLPESFLAEQVTMPPAPSRRRRARFEMLMSREGARDAPSRPADDDAADDRPGAASDAADAGAHGANAGGRSDRRAGRAIGWQVSIDADRRAALHRRHAPLSAGAEAQQPARVVQRASRRLRDTRAPADDRRRRAAGARFPRLRAGARREPEGVDVSHLPRHALLRKQDALQDARRRGLSAARSAQARGRRPVLSTSRPTRSGSAAACTRRRRRSSRPCASTSPPT